jgi:anaerobic ribonucleoside-triphosphate reductase activating protein
MIRLARMHRPVTSLGPGRRVGLWVQGCALGCHGCMSQDTWDPSLGTDLAVSELTDVLAAAYAEDPLLSGLTISGGEPLEQPGAVREILRWLRSDLPEVDSLLYSGWTLDRIRRIAGWSLEAVDALIPEPFVAHRAPGRRWRGSANQPLLLLSDLGRHRHAEASGCVGSDLQVRVVDGTLTVIGVPRPGDLDRMVALARARGLHVGGVSWRN